MAKFLSLLTTSSLHFSQVFQLKKIDPYEGSLAFLNKQFRQFMVNDEAFARTFLQVPTEQSLPPNYREIFHPETERAAREIFSATMYANCWHMSVHESAFLWSNYSSLTDGVAIRSTVGGLCDSVSSEARGIYIGAVRYLDYRTEGIAEGNIFDAFFCKRKSFEHERELRACFWHLVDGVGLSKKSLVANPKGFLIPSSIDALIDEVIISPFALDWCADVIVNLCASLGRKIRVAKSSILDPAIL